MNRAKTGLIILGLCALPLAACSNYGDQRPDVNQLSSGDAGLQSKDVVACTNQLVTDLLSSPQLNASPTQWTLVVSGMQDQTIDKMFSTNYDIFTQSLRSAISEKAQGRIALIENKATFNGLRDSELETPQADPYQQGGSPGNPAPAAINPDYILYGTAIDMPNRSTNFYQLQFNIFNAHTRVLVWSRTYQVKTSRN
jgi:peptidoglycan-synthase activator LpoB